MTWRPARRPRHPAVILLVCAVLVTGCGSGPAISPSPSSLPSPSGSIAQSHRDTCTASGTRHRAHTGKPGAAWMWSDFGIVIPSVISSPAWRNSEKAIVSPVSRKGLTGPIHKPGSG